MKLLLFIILISSSSLWAKTVLPSAKSHQGFIARLLINEIPFPGENGYVSEENSKAAMQQILAVVANRTYHIPNNYTQRQIATVTTKNIIDVITAGGERGQIDGFYLNSQGKLATVPRVEKRINYLLAISNKGTPGKFARLMNYAVKITENFLKTKNIDDIYKLLTKVDNISVTGRGYSWMTDSGNFHPGGTYVKIPNQENGSLGHNRFFTLRKKQ